MGGTPAIATPPSQENHGGTLEQGGELGVQQTTSTNQFGTTSVGTDPAGNRVPLQTMRPVGARIADDAVNVCDDVAHTRWTVSTASTGGSVLTFGV